MTNRDKPIGVRGTGRRPVSPKLNPLHRVQLDLKDDLACQRSTDLDARQEYAEGSHGTDRHSQSEEHSSDTLALAAIIVCLALAMNVGGNNSAAEMGPVFGAGVRSKKGGGLPHRHVFGDGRPRRGRARRPHR